MQMTLWLPPGSGAAPASTGCVFLVFASFVMVLVFVSFVVFVVAEVHGVPTATTPRDESAGATGHPACKGAHASRMLRASIARKPDGPHSRCLQDCLQTAKGIDQKHAAVGPRQCHNTHSLTHNKAQTQAHHTRPEKLLPASATSQVVLKRVLRAAAGGAAQQLSRPRQYRLPSHFVTHVANAWVDGAARLNIQYVGYPEMPDFLGWSGPGADFRQVNPDEQPPSLLLHAAIPLLHAADGDVTQVSTRVLEFPSVHPARTMHPTRFVFAAAALDERVNAPQQVIAVYDTLTGAVATWGRGTRYFPGEPCFVPAPGAEARGGAAAAGDGDAWHGVHAELRGATFQQLSSHWLRVTTKTRHLNRLGQLGDFKQDSDTDPEQERNTDLHSARNKAQAGCRVASKTRHACRLDCVRCVQWRARRQRSRCPGCEQRCSRAHRSSRPS